MQERSDEDERRAFAPVPQVLARKLPDSGRMSLYIASHAGAIRGMADDAARKLRVRHALSEPERAAAAARHFFREANLTALRELSLRLVADHAMPANNQLLLWTCD